MDVGIPDSDSDNPFEEAEFVFYTNDMEKIEPDPQTDIGQELECSGVSFWAQFDDREIPLSIFSEQMSWLTRVSDQYDNVEPHEATDAFIECVATLTSDDVAGGWGGIEKEAWNKLPLYERLVVRSIKSSLVEAIATPELFMVIEAIEEQFESESCD